jgi:hypothetical protein
MAIGELDRIFVGRDIVAVRNLTLPALKKENKNLPSPLKQHSP